MTQAFKTPVEMLDQWARVQGDKIYLRQPKQRRLHDISWCQVHQMAHRLAGALYKLGFEKGDKIAILSKNCSEWFIIDYALMVGGFISVPIYPTANADTIRYVLQHSESKAVFVGKLDDGPSQEPGIGGETLRLGMGYDGIKTQYHWQQLLELAEPIQTQYPDADDVMTIIYTSGSTGNPKGAVMTFGAFSWAAFRINEHLGGTPKDRVISYLPLAHITERAYIFGSSIFGGGTVYFVESLDTFVEDVQVANPNFFLSVPRLWTLFQKNIIAKVGENKLNTLLSIPIIGAFVARKIRKQLGLNNARILGCGSAPVSPALLHWYGRIGMNITEAWGMTENAAYATLNFPFRKDKIGTVGTAGMDVELKIGDNHELLFKSPGLFREYYKQPEATAESMTEDGFFRTGDQAEIDDDGYVSIIGRVKDNFKTAKGKFVAPVPIERKLAQDTNIELLCVIGSGQPYPVALVQLAESAYGLPREQVQASLQAASRAVSATMESHATLGGVLVVQEPWTVENDVLTPTLKIKRHVLEKRFNSLIGNIRNDTVVWEDQLSDKAKAS
ncbi:Long-chain acyl-CoA synthetase (AMP-forming) [Ferrimonas sediminum]|uniref:Long-chain acyl-CoA synthetase (AMP-forming) n=1 Tax=Ferrimonas sediminum TaxID=718193 RepID=A0A1G8XJX2_9GAMM|nr:AMP-binding protein [Ferrimonas sediminum]SDJ90898.1 Long-chain acyl-CoA synthetase (AMP-forming) [Ferrimonas sediminum]